VKSSDDPTVEGPVTKLSRGLGYIRPVIDQLPLKLYSKKRWDFFCPAVVPFSGVCRRIGEIKPDLVHLHWTTSGYLSVEDIARIRQPIVWTLHDMWAFTGGCHYDGGCGRYLSVCESCPMLGSSRKDLSTHVFSRKLRAYRRARDLIVVSPSRWLGDAARKSRLLRNLSIVHIPNPIDPNVFRPMAKPLAREMIGLPNEAKIVLVGAVEVLQDPRKGFMELRQALSTIKSTDIVLAVFGAGRPRRDFHYDFPVYYLGKLHDDLSLRVAYNAADVVVAPSLQENFSNIILESLSCGTPVVGFRVGGNMDMINHQWNGYLAEPYDPSDLTRGMEWVLNHPDPATLSRNARQRVIDDFDDRHVADRYIELYQQIYRKKH
jgi:glycosyltransferase involved in cell wall biosynthesis